ncbi:MAG: ATP-binding protein [Coxiellaceae bacterium]|nr:ATP-binding protein [Coxiellaceae bacterium]
MKIHRDIASQFDTLRRQYPVVAVMGPRQSGKTTLVRTQCEGYPYISLEDPDIRAIAVEDPRALLNQYPDRLIIDEIQYAPQLLSYIQTITDERDEEGIYILTGSQQPEIHQAISQSLAGRVGLLELLPLSQGELRQINTELSINEKILQGGFPRIYKKQIKPVQFYRDYVKTYLERDVRQLINVKDLLLFQKFIKLCAARTGQVLNQSNLANEVGVSAHTIKHWLSVLGASYLIHLLPPYFENFGKQVVKSPKLYFTDAGLAAYLLEIETPSQLARDPLRGYLFETFVVVDILKHRFNQGLEPHLYYYRDAKKNEVDLIFKQGSMLTPVEIKSAQTYRPEQQKGLKYFKKLVAERCGKPYLIYAGDKSFGLDGCELVAYNNCSVVVQPEE